MLDRLLTALQPGRETFRNFWDALVFDRDGYTCVYCGRDAFEFYEQSRRTRTIRLVVDHRDARRKGLGKWELENSATACWSCNNIKGSLPEAPFLAELDSLVEARARLQGKRGA